MAKTRAGITSSRPTWGAVSWRPAVPGCPTFCNVWVRCAVAIVVIPVGSRERHCTARGLDLPRAPFDAEDARGAGDTHRLRVSLLQPGIPVVLGLPPYDSWYPASIAT